LPFFCICVVYVIKKGTKVINLSFGKGRGKTFYYVAVRYIFKP